MLRFSALNLFCLLVGSLCGWSLARADEAIELQPIDVTGAHEALEDVLEPSSHGVRLEVDEQVGVVEQIADLLERIPGVVIRSSGSTLQPKRVMLRGASSQQVLVLLDGVRLNSVSDGSFDLSLLPIAALSEVEVLRGGGALSYGSGAEGGVIRLKTRGAYESGFEGGQVWASEGAGANSSWRSELGGGVWFPTFGVSAALSVAASEGNFLFEDDQGTPRRRANNDATQLGGILSARLGRWLQLTHTTAQTERGAPGPSEFPRRFAAARTRDLQSITSLSAKLPSLSFWDDWLLTSNAQVGYRGALASYENPTALLGGAAFESENVEHTVEPHVETALYLGERGISTLTLDGRHERLTQTFAGKATDSARTVFAAAWIQETLFFDELLEVIVGMRLEGESSLEWLPKLGVLVRPTDEWTLRLNAGKAYRLPTFAELYTKTEFVRGNPDLDGERALQFDLGIRAEPIPGHWFELVGFYSDIDALILFVPASAFTYQARNLTGAASKGVELSLGSSPLAWLALEAGYAFTDAHLSAAPKAPLPGQPRHSWRLASRARLGSLTAQLEGRYTGERALDTFGNRLEEGVLNLDADLTWRPIRELEMSLSAKNLLDNRHSVDALQQALPGFSFFGALTWRQDFLSSPSGP